MARRIRLIEKKTRPTFAQRLEERARGLAGLVDDSRASDPIVSVVEQELALTLDHLDRLRDAHRRIEVSLISHECYLGTEIIQREPQDPVYEDPRLPERDRLRDRLRKIDQERRRWLVKYTEQRQVLLDRLLTLVNRRSQLLI